ncbi:hypothetical protein L1987_41206 [Smallanthus sonchifolius]|uniref:Uncharacterized protein n=1 Tax=Smallanthus sonchifolius TaxID=185202 RepID=A0ACB9GVQ3_9ASTR|nr:hypothetical protein L1987_41206 [Smallanthus sonchifolius]
MDSKSKPHFISTSPETPNPVTTKLQLAHHQSAEALDKEAVLWRIRYHKCFRKVKGTFESMANRTTGDAYEKWSEPIDVFTSP